MTGPGLIPIGIVTVSVEERPPPRVAATIPPAKPAAPTTTRIFHRLLRLLACGPPSSPLCVLLWAMMALVVLCILPQIIFEIFFAKPFDVTAYAESVDYEFTSKDYATEFAMLNHDAAWVKVNGEPIA